MSRARETTTCDGIATALTKFLKFLDDMSIPAQALKVQHPDSRCWPRKRRQFHEALLTSYCSTVTETHKTATTCRAYASKVANFWIKAYHVPLWPDEMFDDLQDYIKGLIKIKMHVANVRLGLSAPDVMVMLRTIHSWSRLQLCTTPRGPKYKWGGHYTCTVGASWVFTYKVALRYGEGTAPSGKDFDHVTHLTRASVRVVDGVRGGPSIMEVTPPKFKVNNRHSDKIISGEIDPSDPLNWPSHILRMMELDPVEPAWASRTPLFRDTRPLVRDPATGRFPPGSSKAGGADALKYSLMLTTLRRVITAESGPNQWFQGRSPMSFGLHSFRIGFMNDLVAAGASYFVVSALGRWTSESVMDYHRMQQQTAHRWARRASNFAMAAALEECNSRERPPDVRSDGVACFDDNAPVNTVSRASDAIKAVTGQIDWALLREPPPTVEPRQVQLDKWLVRLPTPT